MKAHCKKDWICNYQVCGGGLDEGGQKVQAVSYRINKC